MFEEQLKKIRKKKGIKTQQELVDLTGLSINTIKSYESGRKQPGRDNLIKLAEFFDCDIEYLLGKDREGKVVFGEMAEALELLESLPEEERKAMIQLLRTMK